MHNPLPNNVKAVLAQPNVRVVKRVELVRDYWNADTRMIVDVTGDVVKYGKLTSESTIKSVNWTVPNLTVSLNNVDGRYSSDHPASIWKATFQRNPRECSLIFRLQLPMPDGTNYDLHKYMGSVEAIGREEGEIAVVDIVTRHMIHRPLSVKLTKNSGDETVILGGTW
jgi:hypothetical protein